MDGLETLIQAASLLQSHGAQMNDSIIEFRITTRFDKPYERIRAMAEELRIKNIEFFAEAPIEALAKRVNEADVVLGIFGNTLKASLVIPNKVFEGVFCRKPLITMHSPAVEELFDGGESVILVNSNDAVDLAEKILFCKNHKNLAQQYAERAYSRCMQYSRPEVLGRQVIEIIRNCLGS
jgi:glycosyltransferase involved in cell wall biosynthesis